MGRGISKLQKQILGIAYNVNRHTQNGSARVKPDHNGLDGVWKATRDRQKYSCPIVDYAGPKDLNWTIAAHLLYGVAFVDRTRPRPSWWPGSEPLTLDPRAEGYAAAKAGTQRAIRRLCERKLLVLAPYEAGLGRRGNASRYALRWGYLLTEAGFCIGEEYEQETGLWLIVRSGLLVCPYSIRHQWDFLDIADKAREGTIVELLAYVAELARDWDRFHKGRRGEKHEWEWGYEDDWRPREKYGSGTAGAIESLMKPPGNECSCHWCRSYAMSQRGLENLDTATRAIEQHDCAVLTEMAGNLREATA